MKKISLIYVLTFSLLVLWCFNVNAAYLKNVPLKVIQPNGIELNLFASGDEYFFRLHDENNYTVIKDPVSRYYVYALSANDELVSSGIIVGQGNPSAEGIFPGTSISAVKWKKLRQDFWKSTPERPSLTDAMPQIPLNTGNLKNLVVFIRFSNQGAFPSSMNTYTDMFNNDAAGSNSMYNYFKEASYNGLFITSNFYPVSSGQTILSYQDAHPRNYYIPFDAVTNPTGYQPEERQEREHALLQSAVNFIASSVPGSLDIDYNNDGYVDNICFVIRGGTTEWATLLWPHRWVLSTYNVYINGSQVWDYNFQLEDFMPTAGNGVLCHEMFHTLGAPDLYHYTDNGIQPAGSWDIMEANSNPPQSMSAFMKYKYGGWITSLPVLSANGTYSLNPLTSGNGNIYKVLSPNSSTEYFILEYRKQTGTFESQLPGEGLLVWRINTEAGDGNASGPPDEVYLYRPNGTLTENGNIDDANFSADEGRTALNSSTNPTPFLSDGSPGGLNLSAISGIGSTLSFTYEAGGGGEPSSDSISESFEGAFPPESWTKYNGDLGTGWEQQVVGTTPVPGWTGGTVTAVPNGTGGSKMAFCTYTTGGMFWNDQWLISPKVDLTTGYKLSFWVRKFSSQFIDSLTVLISTTNNDPFSFEPFLQLYWSQTDMGWTYHEYSLEGYAGQSVYVAFQEHISDNYANGDALFLDLVRVAPSPQSNIDVGITKILHPTSGYNLTANENLTVRIKNFGSLAQSNVCVSCVINGGSLVTATAPTLISPDDSVDFTFPLTLNLAVSGIYSITAFTCLNGDSVHSNDTTTLNVNVLQEPGILYINGPYFNSLGTGASGANESILQTNTLGMVNFGYTGSKANACRLADEFIVPPDTTWVITGFSFYAYQHNAPLETTINHINIRVWDNIPGAGAVIYGDSLTNILTSSVFSGAYRVLEGSSGNTQRPLMQNLCLLPAPLSLSPGTYYLDWQYDGSLTSGPYSPPIAILGQPYTGNARQYDPGLGSWKNAVDPGSATQQGLPFRVYGTAIADTVVSGVVTSLPQDTACAGSIIVPVRVTNLNNVGAISLVLNHSEGLTYQNYQHAHPSLGSGTLIVNPQSNKVNIGWFSITPANIGTDTLIELIFTAASTSSFTFQWSSIPGACQYQDVNNQTIPSTFMNGWIVTKPCANLLGQLTYDNDLHTVMTSTIVSLKQGNIIMHQDSTDLNGQFEILNINPGNYVLDGQCTKQPGSINAIDALLILRHFVGQIALADLKLEAGDVDASGYVNSADALMTARRFAGIITTFPAGDWIFESKSVTIPSTGTITENFKAICTGDVNGSNVPSLKESSQVSLLQEEVPLSLPSNSFDIPLRVTQAMQAGAISLALSYNPMQLDILGVAASSKGNLVVNDDHGILTVAWFSLEPMMLAPGDICITVSVDCKYNSEEGFFKIRPGCVFGNEQAIPMADVILMQPKIRFTNDVLQIYPNPCSNVLTIRLSALKSGDCKISLLDLTGKAVLSSTIGVTDETSLIQLNMEGLLPGLYTCRIDGHNNISRYFKVVKK